MYVSIIIYCVCYNNIMCSVHLCSVVHLTQRTTLCVHFLMENTANFCSGTEREPLLGEVDIDQRSLTSINEISQVDVCCMKHYT